MFAPNPKANFIFPAAVVLTITGQLLAEATRLLYGVPFIALGIALGIFSYPAHKALWTLSAKTVPNNKATTLSPTSWRLVALAIVLNIAGASVLNFSASPKALGWSLHLGGIALYTSLLIPRSLVFGIVRWPFQFRSWQSLAAIGIFAIALLVRLAALTELPRGIWFDEANYILAGQDVLSGTQALFVYQGHPTNASFYYNALIALSIFIFGKSILAVRLVSVLIGMMSLWVSLKLSHKLYGSVAALLFTGLLAASRWHVTLSRIGMYNITVPLFVVTILGLLLLAMQSNERRYFIAAGLSVGASFWFYIAIQPVLVAITLLLALWGLKNHAIVKHYLQNFGWLSLSAAMVVLPLAIFAVTNSDIFFGRAQSQSVINTESTAQTIQVLAESTLRHIGMFTVVGDANGRHNIPFAPLLDPITGGLFLLGIALTVQHVRKPLGFALLVLSLFALLGGILSVPAEAPHALRTVGILAIVYIFAALPIVSLATVAAKPAIGLSLAITCVLLATTINTYQYFDSQRFNSAVWQAHSLYDTLLAERILAEDQNTVVYASTDINTPTIRFLLGKKLQSITQLTSADVIATNTSPLLIIGHPNQTGLFDDIQQRFPDGTLEIIYTPDGSQAVQFQYSWQP